ncbi:MAG: AraC family transcriptional regulator [Marinobacter sp.]|nr:AraC family transcriptional regulator [Marinobacter sp.]
MQSARRRGLDLSAIPLPDADDGRIPLNVQDALWDAYCQACDDPLPGVQVGLDLEIGHLDSAGMLLVTCETLGEGLDTLVDYAAIVGDGGEFSLTNQNGAAWISYRPYYQVQQNERVDAVMTSLIKLARWATGQTFRPQALELCRTDSRHRDVYAELLGVTVNFGCPGNALRFSEAQLDLPLIQANEPLREHLRNLADHTLEQLGQSALIQKVRRLILANPGWGKERLGLELGLSGRHLARRLSEEGISFKVLRENLLWEEARRLLNTTTTIGQVSLELGFSEESAFIRAFRRWQGETPARYRERLRS